MLPPDNSYVMGFEHQDGISGDMMNGGMMDEEMHFAGFMAFACGAGESDHFFVSGRERTIELGTIMVRLDGGFARPGRNPLDQMDRDGFYDDDMNHDGHHDDDVDGDGHHDCEMGGMGHDDESDDCPGPLTPRPTSSAIPDATPTPDPHMAPAGS